MYPITRTTPGGRVNGRDAKTVRRVGQSSVWVPFRLGSSGKILSSKLGRVLMATAATDPPTIATVMIQTARSAFQSSRVSRLGRLLLFDTHMPESKL
jgi:hypothetical protein